MHAQHAPIDNRRQRAPVEELSAILPRIRIAILSLALVIEPIDLCDLPALVIAPEQSDSVGPTSFEQQEQRHGLYTVVAAIHKVSHEDVAGLRALPPSPEELQ